MNTVGNCPTRWKTEIKSMVILRGIIDPEDFIAPKDMPASGPKKPN